MWSYALVQSFVLDTKTSHLMGPDDQTTIMFLQELSHNVTPKCVWDTPVIFTPACDVLKKYNIHNLGQITLKCCTFEVQYLCVIDVLFCQIELLLVKGTCLHWYRCRSCPTAACTACSTPHAHDLEATLATAHPSERKGREQEGYDKATEDTS